MEEKPNSDALIIEEGRHLVQHCGNAGGIYGIRHGGNAGGIYGIASGIYGIRHGGIYGIAGGVYGHTTWEAPVLVRSLKLSNVGLC